MKYLSRMAIGILSMSLLFSVTPMYAHADEAPKVLVCKYVGTPQTGERLKGGKNPISVSANSLPGYVPGTTPQPGDQFTDAQGLSVVVADGTTECPAPPVPGTRYRVIIRMTGQGVVRDHFTQPTGSSVAGEVIDLTCGTKVTAGFDVQVGSIEGLYGPYTSRKGPVLRVKDSDGLLLKLRSGDGC